MRVCLTSLGRGLLGPWIEVGDVKYERLVLMAMVPTLPEWATWAQRPEAWRMREPA